MDDTIASSIPPEVLHRVVGKQTPVAPHAQRLLVAALKEAKINGTGGDGGNKLAKADKGKPKAKAKAKTTSKKTIPVPKAAAEKKPPREKTPYTLAKDAFMSKLLVSNF